MHINHFQERFLLYNATPNSEEIFHIPINYATADNFDFSETSANLWLTEASLTYNAGLDPSSWLIVNKQQSGNSLTITFFLIYPTFKSVFDHRSQFAPCCKSSLPS